MSPHDEKSELAGWRAWARSLCSTFNIWAPGRDTPEGWRVAIANSIRLAQRLECEASPRPWSSRTSDSGTLD